MADLLLDLIGNIYEAVTDQTLWPWVLGKLADLFGGGGATLSIYDLGTQRIVEYASAGLPDDGIKDYLGGLAGQDPRLAWALAHPAVATYFDRLHTNEARMDQSEFYAWLGRNGFRYSIGRQEFHGGVRAAVTLQRTQSQGHVSDTDIALFDQISPHVLRAVLMARRLGGLELDRSGDEEALERLPIGIVLIDAQGRPLHANRAARELAAARDGFLLGADRASAMRPDDDAPLQRAVSAAIAMGGGDAAAIGDVLSLGRPSGKRPLSARVIPVAQHRPIFAEHQPAALLFLRDPEVVPAPSPSLLKLAYKLTPRECDVALGLVSGKTLEETAKAFGLARATARVHLRSLLHKTGTHSQSALLRLLTAMVPGQE
jgi:DNA-binding CsgD family transcriptional regulator/PAS domain-containing protein